MSDQFQTTHWSVVLAAGRQDPDRTAGQALESLCQSYWYPLYAFIRRRVDNEHRAQDLTQAFFERLLEKRTLASADPQRGKFRAFLLTACKRFLANEWQRANAEKRGGGARTLSLDFELAESRYALEPSCDTTAEVLFEQRWATTLLDHVLQQLRREYSVRNQDYQFQLLKTLLPGAAVQNDDRLASNLNMTPGAVRTAVHRMRSRYRQLLRAEIAQTLDDSEDVDEEIQQLFQVLSGKAEISV